MRGIAPVVVDLGSGVPDGMADRIIEFELVHRFDLLMPRPPTATNLAALRVAVWIAICASVLKTQADPDLWGHVRFGLDWLQSHRLPSLDPYSFTQDVPWINHEWLAEAFMGAAYQGMGSAGLVVLKGMLAIATFLIVIGALRMASQQWRWPSLLLAVLGSFPVVWTVRPQLWTLLFLTCECRILTGSIRARYLLPGIFALWANLHGGWILGLAVLACWSVGECFQPQAKRPSVRFILGIATACLAATLCTPYGWRLWKLLATTVRLSRDDITEWRPIWNDDPGNVMLWLAGAVWVLFVLRYSRERPSAKVLLPVAMLAVEALLVVRLVALFIAASIVLLAPNLPNLQPGAEPNWPKGRTALDLAVACLAVALIVFRSGAPTCIEIRDGWLDISGANALSVHPASGRLVTSFDWGEYAIWHLGPRLKVSIDGRRETVYSDSVRRQQSAIALGEPDALRTLERLSPEYAWLPTKYSNRAKTWFASHGYRIDVETPSSFVAVRHDLPRVQAVTVAASGCFPGP
jgi:hypothetical protein